MQFGDYMLRALTTSLKMYYDNPLIINAYVDLHGEQIRTRNWGDDINFDFIRHLTKRKIAIYFDNPIAMKLKCTNYLCIGSTLNYLSTRQSVVWGAGIIDSELDLRETPRQINAVRGPLTREYLLRRGIQCPEVYGDPALLIPYFYTPKLSSQSQRYTIGIVPHYTDRKAPILKSMKDLHPDVNIIDIVNYGTWTQFIDHICECDAILSSSLHGLIVAEAFGIPNLWIEISKKSIGSGFKFRDFYASIGKSITNPIYLNFNSNPTELLSNHPWTQGRLSLSPLLDACPFVIKEPIRYEHPMDL